MDPCCQGSSCGYIVLAVFRASGDWSACKDLIYARKEKGLSGAKFINWLTMTTKIGSLISVITKAESRYEGTLVEVDRINKIMTV